LTVKKMDYEHQYSQGYCFRKRCEQKVVLPVVWPLCWLLRNSHQHEQGQSNVHLIQHNILPFSDPGVKYGVMLITVCCSSYLLLSAICWMWAVIKNALKHFIIHTLVLNCSLQMSQNIFHVESVFWYPTKRNL